MPTSRRTGKSPTKAAGGPSSSPVVVNARSRRVPASKEDDEDSDPMALSASPKKRKAMHDSPEIARGSPRLRERGNSINYAELNNGKGREGSVKGEEEEDNVELNKRSSSRRTSAVASTSSPAKRATTTITTPAKASTSKPTPTSSRPRRTSRSSPVKPDLAPSSSTSSRPAAAGRRPQRSPSPSATTSSPRKPAGWRGWEVATEPLEEHPQKGFLSGLEILKKQGLLDPEGERRLRNGRTVAKPVGKKDKRGGEARWGDEEEEEEEEEEGGGDGEGEKVEGVMDWEEDVDGAVSPQMEDVGLQLHQPQVGPQQQQQQQQETFSPDLLTHLASTKARVLAHLTGRVPPRPPTQPAVDVKGKGKSRAASPTKETKQLEDVNAESVKTLVELLKGTVERGEGNSCLIQGVKGGGKTTVLNQALDTLIASTSEPNSDVPPPIVIRLSALVQTDDRAAIREIGRQVGVKGVDGEEGVGADAEGEGGDEAKEVLQITTLPAHLLSILTAPSKKAIVIVLDEFDLFAGFGRGGRQMLLYCLLDVVQSIRPTLSSGVLSSRGVAVIGLTSRIDTLHLLEKRVKSRFSHRIIRVSSVLHGDQSKNVVALRPEDAVPLEEEKVEEESRWRGVVRGALLPEEAERDGEWEGKWRQGMERVMSDEGVKRGMERLGWMTGDVRAALRIFIRPILDLTPSQPILTPERIQRSLTEQAEGAGFGLHLHKLAGLSPPELAVLASVKDLGERGITEFNFEHVFFTYSEFAKAKLVGSGKPRFSRGSMREAFSTLTLTSLIFPTSSTSSSFSSGTGTGAADFAKHRCALPAFDLVEFFRSDAGKRGVMTQLSAWGRKWDV